MIFFFLLQLTILTMSATKIKATRGAVATIAYSLRGMAGAATASAQPVKKRGRSQSVIQYSGPVLCLSM
jgi:hypothetical protein